jgi:hypothetical protein
MVQKQRLGLFVIAGFVFDPSSGEGPLAVATANIKRHPGNRGKTLGWIGSRAAKSAVKKYQGIK